MSREEQLEIAQLMARFKLQVKRSLNETVDLERLARDVAYARQRLAEVEEAAFEEELLVMVLRLRSHLLPVEPGTPTAVPPEEQQPAPRETRRYLLGARAW